MIDINKLKEEIWFICNKENAIKIIKVLEKHGVSF